MSNDGATWSGWVPAQPSVPWTTDPGEGTRTVTVQFIDAAGNLSATASDSILLDSTPPTGTFVLKPRRRLRHARRPGVRGRRGGRRRGRSGVADFRSSVDAGATWTAWSPISADHRAAVPRPPSIHDARFTIQGQFRDVAGNVSVTAQDVAYLIDDVAPDVTPISSFIGTVGVGGDIDAVRIQLVAGDKLSLKFKSKTLVKKADAHVEVDVYGPNHAQLVTGHFPVKSKAIGVAAFPAPATGEYWIVLRSAGKAADTGVSYTMAVTNAAAKGSRTKKGIAPVDADFEPPVASISFDAVDGLKLAGTLTVTLADTSSTPTLTTPGGATVALTVALGKNGSMKIAVPALAGGPGTYRLSIPVTGAVKYAFTLAPAKPGKLDEASLPPH